MWKINMFWRKELELIKMSHKLEKQWIWWYWPQPNPELIVWGKGVIEFVRKCENNSEKSFEVLI